MRTKKILVLCTGNSCRSQIAEGYLRYFTQGKAAIYSAGIEAHGVNPLAVEVMGEDGIDISAQTSNLVSDYTGMDFDYVITVCDNAQERCPFFPSGAIKFHHNFPDPAKATGTAADILQEFRRVRDQVKDWSRNLLPGLDCTV